MTVQDVQTVPIVQTPSCILPRDGGGKRWGKIEQSAAIELLERFEPESVLRR
jgi:hypothetical protein